MAVEGNKSLEKSGIFSHPFTYIEDHINRCLNLGKFFLSKNLSIVSEDFERAFIIATALHDFGKTTEYFQEYMRAIMEKRPYRHPVFNKRKLTEHALLGGIYAFYVSRKVLKDELLPFSVFVACKRHHTDPKSFISEAGELGKEDEEFLKEQISSIDERKTNVFISSIELPEDVKNASFFRKKELLEKIGEIVEEINSYRRFFRKTLKGECRTSFNDFLTFQYLFSLLLDADKTEAGAREAEIKREDISFKVIEKFRKTLKRNRRIDELREEAYKEVIGKEPELDKKVYSITLPTGMGKTLTGFAYALKLREKIFKEKKIKPRIIYSLPFLSIIDQNAEVLKSVLETEYNVKTSLLLKHHHLSEKEYDEYEFSVSRILIEGWNSEIIITTFVQLFHTLFGNKNSEIRRFNKLANSIVILDEVQALPHRYWHIIRKMLKEISEKLNTYIILMTATQPYLIENTVELANRKYFKLLNRLTFKVDLAEKTVSEFTELISLDKDKTYLFIANTINEAKELYKKLKEKVDEEICFLSTHITPYDRKKRIEDIKKGKYRIAVSTQLVEAGVDIDFDVVFRDLAPFDSLIQSAGRCNRNMTKGKGEFIVVNLINEKDEPYWKHIYDPVLVLTTKKLLERKESFSEPEFTELCEEYFRTVWRKISPDISQNLEEAIKCLRFRRENKEDIRTYLSDFELIEKEPYKSDVFIELNEEAKAVWRKAKNIIKSLKERKLNIFQAKEEFERIKPEFFQFVISVDVRNNEPPVDEELGIYYVGNEFLESFYDMETGFKAKGEEFEIW